MNYTEHIQLRNDLVEHLWQCHGVATLSTWLYKFCLEQYLKQLINQYFGTIYMFFTVPSNAVFMRNQNWECSWSVPVSESCDMANQLRQRTKLSSLLHLFPWPMCGIWYQNWNNRNKKYFNTVK
jgi:hypothetical protein